MKPIFFALISSLLTAAATLYADAEPVPGSDPAPAADPAAPAPAPAPALPTVAPKWTLKGLNGKPVSSEKFKGKVVVIDFWATWCVPCREEVPAYIALQKKYKKDGLVVIGVSMDEEGAKVVKPFVEKFGVNYQMVIGTDEVAAAFGGAAFYPTTYIIDREGKIRDRKVGPKSPEEFEKRVLAILK